MKHSYHLLLCLLFGILSASPLAAQTDDPATAELLENFFRDNESASESDALQYIELLENLRNNPLNLNRVSRDELLGLHVLNDIQVESFLKYRAQFGPFLNEFELQAIPKLDVSDIRKLLRFTTVKTGLDTRNTNILKGLWQGQNELLLRWGRPMQPNYPTDRAEGEPNNIAVRYRHSFDNRIRFGFTAESDAGEAIFKGSNPRGFDFYSAHLFIQNLNQTVKAVALGDFTARFGQGLLMQSGFAPGKSAETVSVARGGRKINGYGAFGEVYFLRGAATTLAFGKHIEVTVLYSDKKRDANIGVDTTDLEDSEIIFSALQTSGLHRLPAEIEDEKVLRERLGGISATYNFKMAQITANALRIEYDRPWQPSEAPYRIFTFRGRQLTAASVDYNWRKRNFLLFGETARSDNGGMAAVNGLLFAADRHVTFTAVHRHLGRDYQSIYANPFSEITGAANEQGLYLGTDIRWTRRWQLNFYADVWRHPWLRFEVNGPSHGREFLGRVMWQKGRNFTAYVLAQTETKQRNLKTEDLPILSTYTRNRLRFHAIYKLATGIEMRSRVEWTVVQQADFQDNKGFLAYQEAVVKPLGTPVSGTLRYGIFDTDDFDSRVFAYENDLFSAVSIPAFSGRGTRYYLNVQWRVNRWLRLEGRYEETNTRRAVTTTGLDGKRSTWKLQARVTW